MCLGYNEIEHLCVLELRMRSYFKLGVLCVEILVKFGLFTLIILESHYLIVIFEFQEKWGQNKRTKVSLQPCIVVMEGMNRHPTSNPLLNLTCTP